MYYLKKKKKLKVFLRALLFLFYTKDKNVQEKNFMQW